MTRIKKTSTTIQQGDKKVVVDSEYVEVSAKEANEMLNKVHEGGNEEELRKELIETSKW